PINPPAIIQWLFDGDFNDAYGTYNGHLVNNTSVTWMSPGYTGYGISRFLLGYGFQQIFRSMEISLYCLFIAT
ncbi:unnamed protein product, partial [Adineta steineri]